MEKKENINFSKIAIYILVAIILLLLGWKISGINLGPLWFEKSSSSINNQDNTSEVPDSPQKDSQPIYIVVTATPIENVNSQSFSDSTNSACDGYGWEACWVIDDELKTITWIGVQDGISDIGQDGEALIKLKSGYTAIVTLDKDLTINICSGTIDGIKPGGGCPKELPISSGTHRIISMGESGGFRIYYE